MATTMAMESGNNHQHRYTLNPSVYLEYKKQRNRRGSLEGVISTEFHQLIDGLAKGNASKVDVVVHSPTNLVVVMKIFKPGRGRQADDELAVLKIACASPFLIHCYDVFIQQDRRCLLLQYAPFGNLDNLTRTLKGLRSDATRMYAKEIVQGLHFLHSHHIIHRDVKPENMLILGSGHVVLADFNIAFRMTRDSQTSSQMCGTYLTRPPEIWQGTSYNRSLDIWMYGVSLYNIASNKWPFLHADRGKHVAAIKSGVVNFNDIFFSAELSDLILQTLQVDDTKRIPTTQILDHVYFKGGGKSQNVPLSPSELLTLVVKSPVERGIIQDILQNDHT